MAADPGSSIWASSTAAIPSHSGHGRALGPGDAPTSGPAGAPGRGHVFNPHDRALGDAPTSASSRGRRIRNRAWPRFRGHPHGRGFRAGASCLQPRGHGRCAGITSTGSSPPGGDREPRPCRLTGMTAILDSPTSEGERGHVRFRAWPRQPDHPAGDSSVHGDPGPRPCHSGHGRGNRVTTTGAPDTVRSGAAATPIPRTAEPLGSPPAVTPTPVVSHDARHAQSRRGHRPWR